MDLEDYLQLLCSSLPPTDALVTVETLIKIMQNVLDHPDEENYRRLRTANKTFHHRVWRHPAAQEFMTAIGWIAVEGDVVLPSDSPLCQEAVLALTKCKSLLEEHLKTTSNAASCLPSQPEPTTTAESDSSHVHKERMRKLKETQKKVEEEKTKIAEQIKTDRLEASKRETKASHGRQLKFGSNLNRFEDIGVDLNAGG